MDYLFLMFFSWHTVTTFLLQNSDQFSEVYQGEFSKQQKQRRFKIFLLLLGVLLEKNFTVVSEPSYNTLEEEAFLILFNAEKNKVK